MLDMAKELEKTLYLHSDELPFIELNNSGKMRILEARVEDNFYITQFRAQPGWVSGLHKHRPGKGGYGFTLRGTWGHDERCIYGPGTLIYETPGVIHRFVTGPEEAEVIFFGAHDVDFVDPETLEVTNRVTGEESLKRYIELCEEQGVKPRFLS